MNRFRNRLRRSALMVCLAVACTGGVGCTLADGFLHVSLDFMNFWKTTPLIPVSAYWSQEVEDTYYEDEVYKRVHILDPVEGENAPIYCLDPPTPDEVMRALPEEDKGGFAFLAETQLKNVRMVVEPIVDRVDPCRFYPLVGPARLHHCHYKCTVFYDKIRRSAWPVPFTHKDETQQVVYIDHDHLIRCAGPATGP